MPDQIQETQLVRLQAAPEEGQDGLLNNSLTIRILNTWTLKFMTLIWTKP